MTEEEKKTAKDNASYRLVYFWAIAIAMLIFSVGANDMLLNSDNRGSYLDYFFVSPFATDKISKEFFRDNWWYTVLMLVTSFTVRAFYLGNPKKSYIKKLEKIKRASLSFIPFYFDDLDARNNYIRFGMKESFKNAFLERKISQGEYLKKVDYLDIFVGKSSPDHILNLRTNYITNAFKSNDYYIETFRIIEGYIGGNIDLVKNVPFKDYWAIGTTAPNYSNESIETFIKTYVPKDKVRKFKYTRKEAQQRFEGLLDNISKMTPKEKVTYKKEFILLITNNKPQPYINHVNKMIVFSPLAVKEAIGLIEAEAIRFITRHQKLKTSLINKLNEYGIVELNDFIEIVKFISFYKIINLFMGLPSGIVTARLESYELSRIVDDIELFEKNRTIRQIKPLINDKRGKYDDTKARAYMIFHHELFLNSVNSKTLEEIFERFDGLRTLSLEPLPNINLSSFDGAESDKLAFIENNKLEDGWVYKKIEEDK
jgi:hypothetical protein